MGKNPTKRKFYQALVQHTDDISVRPGQYLVMEISGSIYRHNSKPYLSDDDYWMGQDKNDFVNVGQIPSHIAANLDHRLCFLTFQEVEQFNFELKIDDLTQSDNKRAEELKEQQAQAAQKKVAEFLELFKDEAPDSWI